MKKNIKSNHNQVRSDELISIHELLGELGMQHSEWNGYRSRGQVEGLISVAGRYLVDRRTIYISPRNAGSERFRIWLQIGGRECKVSVDEELKRQNRSLSRNFTYLMRKKFDILPYFEKQRSLGMSGNT